MVREDLLSSAVSFLQDPSVSSAPVEKRIAFLQSKNLTQEEIDVALARAASGDEAAVPTTPVASAPPVAPQPGLQHGYRQPMQYPPYGQGYWQPPPPELPRRDWRDWFIMATVVGGVGYGVYVTAKRYLVPLIAPPTPPQLTADKEHIDSSLTHINSLLEQLSKDTANLKAAEDSRTARLDAALSEVESVLSAVKDAGKAREDDARRLADDVRGLRDLVPLAIERNKEGQENRLRELGTEVRGLRTLVGNRFNGNHAPAVVVPSNSPPGTAVTTGTARSPPVTAGTAKSPQPVLGSNTPINGTAGSAGADPGPVGTPASALSPSTNPALSPDAESLDQIVKEAVGSTNPYGRLTNGKASIPAWQLAASKKNKTEEEKKEEVIENIASAT